jgi:predicted RNA binding protein YcfA (HicA-like mRNA interferase family)
MTKLPRDVSGAEAIRALEKAGYVRHNQQGSHVALKREDPPGRVTVPMHRTLGVGILRAIIRQAGMSVDEFVKLL